MLTKTLRTLIERAERKGRAVKRVRQNHVMGSYSPFGAVHNDSPLIEQWAVTMQSTRQDGEKYTNIIVDHYGTEIAHIVINRGRAELVNYYGESKSDRDALNGLCDYYSIDRGFRYRPSTGEFIELTKAVTA